MREQITAPLTKERVAEVLQKMNAKFLQDSNGNFLLFIGIPFSRFVAITVVKVEETGPVLVVRGSVQNLPPWDAKTLLKQANTWNTEMRWPRVFLRGDELMFDYHVPLGEGVSEAQLKDFLGVAFGSVQELLDWLGGTSDSGEDLEKTPRMVRA